MLSSTAVGSVEASAAFATEEPWSVCTAPLVLEATMAQYEQTAFATVHVAARVFVHKFVPLVGHVS